MMSEKAGWERAWDSADEHPNIDGFTYKEGFRIGYLAAKSEQEAAIRAAQWEAWLQGLQFALAGMPTARELEKFNPYPTEKSDG